jgi:hypothetical protein
MSIALMAITDAPAGGGKNSPRLDYLKRTVASAREFLHGDVSHRFIVADCAGNTPFLHAVEEYSYTLEEVEDWAVLGYGRRLGFAGAIQAGWAHVRGMPKGVTHVFHLEGDFTFNQHIDLDVMAEALDADHTLTQLALMRQPWNSDEARAGGIIQLHPEDFKERVVWREGNDDEFSYTPDKFYHYVAHSRFFTTNPSLYRRGLLEVGWPDAPESEGKFSIELRNRGYHFGFWQDELFAPPSVEHIGQMRTGSGY